MPGDPRHYRSMTCFWRLARRLLCQRAKSFVVIAGATWTLKALP
jgi:hypothetical protein